MAEKFVESSEVKVGILNRELTKFLKKRYSEDTSIKRKIDIIIKDFVPKEIKDLGLEMSISWSLKNLKPSEIDDYIKFKDDVLDDG
jgi:hypothetical protein